MNSALLEVESVTKVYPRGIVANDDVSLHIDAGEIYGLLGPNGAGKTTLVSQILGLIEPTSGSISIAGTDVTKKPKVARKACSYQPQTTASPEGLTPLQAVEIVGRIRGLGAGSARARGKELMDALDIRRWADKRIPLSGGVGRLTSFCMAAVAPGRIVVLDEPTNDVDPLRRKLLWEQVRLLAKRGSAVLLVTHNVLEAERSVDRLAIMVDGRLIAQGTLDSLKSGLGALGSTSLEDVYARLVAPSMSVSEEAIV
ncbi:MAG TPA: ABC transporter ATP-binding protein [Actinomycetota bacterium]|nr:ABC transporter ATP-binding protein [Actinomycetota bacterium]